MNNTSRMVKISEELAGAIDERRSRWETRNPTLSAGADLRRSSFRGVISAMGSEPALAAALDAARSRFASRPSHWFEDIGISPDDDALLHDLQAIISATKKQARVAGTPVGAAEQLLYMLHAWPRNREEFEAYQRRSPWASFVNEVLRDGLFGSGRAATAFSETVEECGKWHAPTAKSLHREPLF